MQLQRTGNLQVSDPRNQPRSNRGPTQVLTIFRKTSQHDQRQIDRVVRAQKLYEREHHGTSAETHERQV